MFGGSKAGGEVHARNIARVLESVCSDGRAFDSEYLAQFARVLKAVGLR